MPRYTHRGRSSSSSSSSRSPAPKHKSGTRRSSDRSPRRSNRRSRSRSPRRRRSPSPRRRSPPRNDYRRRSPFRPRPRSHSPKRRSSPRRRSPARRRSPSPRTRYRGSSPRTQRRPSPRMRSPPRESRPTSSRHQSDSHHREGSPYRQTSDTNRDAPQRESQRARSEPRTQETSRPAPITNDPPREEWIPGLDVPPSQSSSNIEQVKMEPSYEASRRRDEDFRQKQADSTSHLDFLDRREAKGRDPYMSSTHDMDISSSSNRQPAESRDTDHHNHASMRHSERSHSPQYVSSMHTSEKSRGSPERRHEAERNYDWIHTRDELTSAPSAPEPVRISVNLPASPGDVDLRRDRTTAAPWERKRQDYRESVEVQDHRRDHDVTAKSVPHVDTQRYFPPSSASTVPSRGSLSSRFGQGMESERPFTPKENISVGIQRNLKDGDERIPIKRNFIDAEVVMPRRKEEGEMPLSLREEFVTRPEEEEEVEERRVIKVVKSEPERQSRSIKRENFEVRRENFSLPSLSDRWREGDGRIVESSSDRHRERSDSRKDPDRRSREDSRRQSPRRHESRDERYVSDSVRKFSKTESDYSREDLRSRTKDRKQGKFERDPSDLRHNLAIKRRRDSDREERPERDIRSRIGERRDGSRSERSGSHLPDFGKRTDKYSYEEWKDKPEMIPKGPSYYEHDNRDTFIPRGRGFRGRFRGRGRGFSSFRSRGGGFRGRGRGGFTFRGRGFARKSSVDREREWKHDKFKEIEENRDERPTSTTEK